VDCPRQSVEHVTVEICNNIYTKSRLDPIYNAILGG